ncbi:hypothetical protein KA005_78220 [bacterium]|nr:hypothetical protein [bacterium]
MKSNDCSVLFHPWKRCESHFVKIAERKEINDKDATQLTAFLKHIGWVDYSSQLAQIGRDFYHNKYIENNEKEANLILSESLRASKPVVRICSVFWGNTNITRDNIYRLLLLNRMIPEDTKPTNIASYLMFLNSCNILRYSKKTNNITIGYNPRTESPENTEIIIAPTTPYSNIKCLWECIRKCKEHIHWIDKHFSTKGLEPLSDELDGNIVKEVKILLGNRSNINYEKLRRDFKRFSEEMGNRGIKADCRVICDSQLLGNIHGRWILGKNIYFNIPPINSIYKGQFDEIKETKNIPPLDNWWKKALDIINNWEQIEPTIKK